MQYALSFVWRNKQKFLLSGLVSGTAYLSARYCLNYVSRVQQLKAQEFIDLSKKQHHFEKTERTCNQTLMSLISSFYDSVDRLMDTERIINLLKNHPSNKVALWEELKVLMFSRVCLINYAAPVINIILRVQINVIGGYMYKNATNNTDTLFSASMQEEYLLLCRYFLSDGMEELSGMILRKVKDIVCRIPLAKKFDWDELQRLLWTLQSAIEIDQYDPVIFMERYARKLGSTFKRPLTERERDIFEEVVEETVDILSSDDVCNLTTSLVWAGYQYTSDRLKEYFVPTIHDTFKNSLNVIPEREFKSLSSDKRVLGFLPMAKLIPLISQLVKSPSPLDTSDGFMHYLVRDESLKVLGANIYEAYCQ